MSEDAEFSSEDYAADEVVLGSASWSVVDSDGAPIAGTSWALETEGGTVYAADITDCVQVDTCSGADKDPAAGSFNVERVPLGNYVLKQIGAPEGYAYELAALPLSVTESVADVVLGAPIVNTAPSVSEGESPQRGNEGDGDDPPAAGGGPSLLIDPPNSNGGPGLGTAPAAGRIRIQINKAGGDRVYEGGITPLEGAVFAAYAPTATGPALQTSNTGSQTWPTLPSNPVAHCTTDAAGQCWMDVPTRANVGGSGRGYVVKQIEAPDGWQTISEVNYGSASAVGGQTPYQFYVPGATGSQTYALPASDLPRFGPTGNTNNRDSSGTWMSARDNLSIPEACGLNVGALVDLSGSVGTNSAYPYLHDALSGLVAALAGTPSQMAVYTFGDTSPAPDTTGSGASQITRDNANRGLATVNGNGTWTQGGKTTTGVNLNLINHVRQIQTAAGSQGTNWDAGFQAYSQAASGLDVVIMLTDGLPTRWGYPSYAGPSSRATMRTLEEGVASANLIKSLGVPVIAVGIGPGVSGEPNNLKAISGTTAGTDFYQTSWENLADQLKELASGNCKGTISLHKVSVDANGNPIEPNPATSNGISFDLTSTGLSFVDANDQPLDPPNSTTMTTGVLNNQNGWAQANYEVPTLGATGGITISERDSDKFVLRDANCSAEDATITVNNDGSITISDIGAGNPQITCRYDNEYRPLVKVNKQWTVSEVDASGAVTDSQTYTGATLPDDAIAGATGTASLGLDPKAPADLNTGKDVDNPSFGTEYIYDFGSVGWRLDVSEGVTGVPAHCVLGDPTFAVDSGAAIDTVGDDGLSFTTEGLERDLNEYTITNTLTCTPAGLFGIEKEYDDTVPEDTDDVAFSGTYACTLEDETVAQGTWSRGGEGDATLVPTLPEGAVPGETVAVPAGASCTATETAIGGQGLTDNSEGLPSGWVWGQHSTNSPRDVASGGTATVTVTNRAEQLPGSAKWAKVDTNGHPLEGSEWLLEGPDGSGISMELPGDCDATAPSPATGPYCVESGNAFTVGSLPWGDYTLTETKAPVGYQISEDSPWEFTLPEGSGEDFSLEWDGGDIENEQRDGPDMPLTGGQSAAIFTIFGLLLLGGAGGAALYSRRRQVAREGASIG